MEALTTNYIQQAVEEYDRVMEELNRPKRDLVMIAAIELVMKSTADFLSAYLAEKGILHRDSSDLLHMQQLCASFDPAFADLKFESIATLNDDSNFAYSSELDENSLKRYVETLRRTKELVVQKVNRL